MNFKGEPTQQLQLSAGLGGCFWCPAGRVPLLRKWDPRAGLTGSA